MCPATQDSHKCDPKFLVYKDSEHVKHNKPKEFVIEKQTEGLRKKLDDEIGRKLQEWQDVVKEEKEKEEAKKKHEMEVVTQGMEQLRTDVQPK